MKIVDHGMHTFVPLIYKVEIIISLAFKWLIVPRSAIKTCDQKHRDLKNMSAAS